MFKRRRQRVTFTDIVVWAIGAVIGIAVIYGTIVTWRTAQYSAEQWINLTIDGLKLGGVYALIALGYTLKNGCSFLVAGYSLLVSRGWLISFKPRDF